MAYRALVVGDDVKIVKCGDWSGLFGKVLTVEGMFYKVRLQLWGNKGFAEHYFTEDHLLISTGNPHRHLMLTKDDEDSFFHDEDDSEMTDSEIMQDLLQRVSKLEKEVLDMKSQRA